MAEFRRAVAVRPDYVVAWVDLGTLLDAEGAPEEAVAALRRAVELKPEDATAQVHLGLSLRHAWRYGEALAALRRGHELGSRQPGWSYPSARWVEECRRWADLDAKLPAVLRGGAAPADAGERIGLATLCYQKGLHASAARLATQAFAERPALADELDTGYRYNAACAATLAGAGQGKDDPPPDEAARAGLRGRAVAWLRADLGAWAKRLDAGTSEARDRVRQVLSHWQADPELAGLRDSAAMATLAEAERSACKALWAEVAAVLSRAGGPPAR